MEMWVKSHRIYACRGCDFWESAGALGFDGVDYQMALGAFAFAEGADVPGGIELEMDKAAFAGRHGIEMKGNVSFADALGGDARGKLQLFEAEGAKAAAIELHAMEIRRAEMQASHGEVFHGEKELALSLEKQFPIGAMKIHGQQNAIFRASRG